MFFACAADEVVPAALEQEPALGVEADGAVGTVDLLFDDEMPAVDFAPWNGVEVLIARTEARPFDVAGTRILSDRRSHDAHIRIRGGQGRPCGPGRARPLRVARLRS